MVNTSFLPPFSSFALIFALVLSGPIPNVSAQDRSPEWQKRAERSKAQYEQYVNQNREQIIDFARKQRKKYRAAVERAREKGIPIRIKNSAGETVATFSGFGKSGLPLYVSSTSSVKSAEIINTKPLWSGQWLLDGVQEKIGLWEAERGRPLSSHEEFGSRVQYEDDLSASPTTHATHVAGIMIARGQRQQAHGMASKAEVYAWRARNDIADMGEASISKGIKLSNHSYGQLTGWEIVDDTLRWYGDPTVDGKEDYSFGFYGEKALNWDELVRENRYYLPIKSAGMIGDKLPSFSQRTTIFTISLRRNGLR